MAAPEAAGHLPDHDLVAAVRDGDDRAFEQLYNARLADAPRADASLMQLTLDAGFGNLLNDGNVTKLNGNLQTEAICQAPVHPDVPDAQRTCANFSGTVPIPAVGTHVSVTGVYVLDSDHGWMEIHPISVLTAAR